MAKKLYEESSVQDIANAIREKTGGAETYKIAQMGGAVRGIKGGAKPVTYSQVNAVAAAYLADVTYDPGDYSTSQIEQYTGQTTDYRKDQPAGVSVPVVDGTLTASDALGGVLRKDVRSGTETLYNLAPSAQGADYVVQRSGIVSGSGHLTPTGALRMIKVGTTLAEGSPFNIRDLGGWTCDGGTVRYGLLFRGGELNGKSYGVRLTDADRDVLCTQLGIRAEIDLRSASEISGVSGSALGSAAAWEHYAITPYATGVNVDGLGAEYAPVLRSIIQHVCANEPCYIHCLLGADRTGTVCAIIEALLGVSQSDIDKDYELTSFKGEMRRRSDAAYDVTKDYRGMKIEVAGQFRSYNRHEGTKNKLVLSIFVRELRFLEDDEMPEEQSKSNQIFLDGYVCKPPIYRKTPLGREIADILVAVNRPYGKSDYIPCIAWGRNARFAGGLEVGAHLQVSGRVQSREYTKKIGEEEVERRVAYEVSVSKIDLVEDEE